MSDTSALGALTTQRATAALGAGLSMTIGRNWLAKIPGGNVGLMVGGAGIAIAGAKALDGHAGSLVVGFGIGAVFQGALGFFMGAKGA